MNLHVLVPSLFWPDASSPEFYKDLPLPALENLLAKASHTSNGPEEAETWLCRACGVSKQMDWPIASLTVETESAGSIKAGTDYWIRADPVHLRIDRNRIVLADSRIFQISPEEGNQLTSVLNQHFSESGQQLVFLPARPESWYVRATGMPAVHTHSLADAVNRPIDGLLPFGANESHWRNLFNEIQMVLHDHPLNLAREARGALPINGTWFWGGGIFPESVSCPYTQVWSNRVVARSLARAGGADDHELPANATVWQESAAPGDHLVVLDALFEMAQYGDVYGWREALRALERNWFSPVHTLLKQGKFRQLIITTMHSFNSDQFALRSGDLKKFWRRAMPLASYAAN